MILHADHQKVYIISPELFVQGTEQVYKATYYLSGLWADLRCIGVFKREDGQVFETGYIYDGATVTIPWEVFEFSGYIRCGVYGVQDDPEGDPQVYPTVWSEPRFVPEGCVLGASAQPSPTIIGQLISTAEHAEEVAQSVRDDADEGKFDGKSAYEVAVEEGYTGTEEEWLASLVGPMGPQGPDGHDGVGIQRIDYIGRTGPGSLTAIYHIVFTDSAMYEYEVADGDSVDTIAKTGTDGLVDTYTITLVSGATHTFTVTNGAKGDTGPQGETGPAGPQGPQGPKGDPGDDYTLTAQDKQDIADIVVTMIGSADTTSY